MVSFTNASLTICHFHVTLLIKWTLSVGHLPGCHSQKLQFVQEDTAIESSHKPF